MVENQNLLDWDKCMGILCEDLLSPEFSESSRSFFISILASLDNNLLADIHTLRDLRRAAPFSTN